MDGRSTNRLRFRLLCSVFVLATSGIGCGTSTPPNAPPPPAASQGPLSLQNNVLTADTDNLSVSFHGAALASVMNKLTGESYIAQPGASWFSVNMLDPLAQPLTAGTW